MNKNLCPICNTEFDKNLDRCPKCGDMDITEQIKLFEMNRSLKSKETDLKEGIGRKHRTGGEMCDFCPHCYGNEHWCPIMDSD